MRKLFSKKIVPVCALSKLFGVPSNFRIGLEKPKKKMIQLTQSKLQSGPLLGP
jgi:hypothetical protein